LRWYSSSIPIIAASSRSKGIRCIDVRRRTTTREAARNFGLLPPEERRAVVSLFAFAK
jgi:hypothetical protein